MLVYASKLIGLPILSVQAGGRIGQIEKLIIDPDTLKIIAFTIGGGLISRSANYILDTSSIREYSGYGLVIDSIDELVAKDDIIKIAKVLELNFDLINLKVLTKKRSKLGKIIDFTVTTDNFTVEQLIVKRPTIKSFTDPELTIPRSEIIEVTDYEIIVKDEEKIIKQKSEKEEFIPNFVNPFRKNEQVRAPAQMKTPVDKGS